MIPQLINIFLMIAGAFLLLKKRNLTYKVNFHAAFIANFFIIGLYYWGGFFDKIEIPQILILIFCLISIIANIENDEQKTGNLKTVFVFNIIYNIVLYFGGFYDIFSQQLF